MKPNLWAAQIIVHNYKPTIQAIFPVAPDQIIAHIWPNGVWHVADSDELKRQLLWEETTSLKNNSTIRLYLPDDLALSTAKTAQCAFNTINLREGKAYHYHHSCQQLNHMCETVLTTNLLESLNDLKTAARDCCLQTEAVVADWLHQMLETSSTVRTVQKGQVWTTITAVMAPRWEQTLPLHAILHLITATVVLLVVVVIATIYGRPSCMEQSTSRSSWSRELAWV